MSDETKQHAMTCGAIVVGCFTLLVFAFLIVKAEVADDAAEQAKFEAVRAAIESAE
jgi:hypothetical protein